MYEGNPPRSSSPIHRDSITNLTKNLPPGLSFRDIFQETGDSTRSLLAPLYDNNNYDGDEKSDLRLRDSIENGGQKEQIAYAADEATKDELSYHSISSNSNAGSIHSSKSEEKNSERTVRSEKRRTSSTKSEKLSKETNQSSRSSSAASNISSSTFSSSSSSTTISHDDSIQESICSPVTHYKGKTWDDWVLEKAIFEMERMKLIRKKQKEHKEKGKTEAKEKIKRETQAEQTRKDWLQQKSYETEKIKSEKIAQIEYEKLKEQQEKELLDEKVKHKYMEWCVQKDEEKNQTLSKKKSEQRLKQEALERKKLDAEHAYKKWLKRSCKKTKNIRRTDRDSPARQTYLDSIYDSPKPSFVNPVPWFSPENVEDNASSDYVIRNRRCGSDMNSKQK